MINKETKIKNYYLDIIMLLLKKSFNENSNVHDNKKINRIKIYSINDLITLQVKNTITKKVIRFTFIKDIDTATPDIKLVFQNRNPNTIEFFHVPFITEETITITNIFDIDINIFKAISFLNTPSSFNSINFCKIKTCKDKENLDKTNVLVKTILNVNESIINNIKYLELTFKEPFPPFKITMEKMKEKRIPKSDDLFFESIDGEFQTYSALKSQYLFELN